MSSVASQIAEFALSTGDERRALLLALSAGGEDLRLGDFGGSPAASPVHVVDIDGELHVVSWDAGMVVAARSCGMEVYEPMPAQDASGRVDRYEVWADQMGCAVKLAMAPTEDAARTQATEALQDLVGSLVVPLGDWSAAQRHLGFDPKRSKRRAPVWGTLQAVHLVGKWMAAGAYSWTLEPQDKPHRVRQSEAIRLLQDNGLFDRVHQKGRHAPRFGLRVVTLGDMRFVSYHDLVNAARHGVYNPALRPWPNVNANAYVVEREFGRFMRAKGWRAPWSDEDPLSPLRLHGRVWVRDTPLLETPGAAPA